MEDLVFQMFCKLLNCFLCAYHYQLICMVFKFSSSHTGALFILYASTMIKLTTVLHG